MKGFLPMDSRVKGAFLTVFGGVCWGLSGSMGQYLFTKQGMDSRWLVPIRLGLAGIIMFIYCLIRYRKDTFKPISNKVDLGRLIVYGLFGVSCSQFSYFLCIQLSTAAMGTILQDLSPIFILMVTCIRGHRRPKSNEIVAVVLAIFGVVLLATHGSIQNAIISLPAIISGVICAVCVMIYNCSDSLIAKYPTALLQAYAFLIGGVFFAFVFRSWTIQYTPNSIGLFGIAFVVIVGNVLAFTSYIKGVSYIGPEKGILYGFSEPITAAVITATVFRTALTPYDIAGFVLIFLMLVLISRK